MSDDGLLWYVTPEGVAHDDRPLRGLLLGVVGRAFRDTSGTGLQLGGMVKSSQETRERIAQEIQEEGEAWLRGEGSRQCQTILGLVMNAGWVGEDYAELALAGARWPSHDVMWRWLGLR